MAFDWEVMRVNCKCQGEEISVGYDPGWPCIDLAFWHAGLHGQELGWWQRLRHAWHVLWTGMPFSDMVILDSKETQKLVDVLVECIARLEEDEKKAKEGASTSG